MRTLGALALLTLAACGGGSTSSPESTVSAFARALADGRYDDAYDLMSEDYRRRVSYEDFAAHLRENQGEALETAEALSRPDGEPEAVATVAYADGEELELVQEDGSWHIASNVADYYDQSTPRAALRSFVRAMERQRYDVVLRMVPDADREGMSVDGMREAFTGEGREDAERLLANLRAHLDDPIEVVGDRATMPYGERYTAQLVREGALWKVEDPE